MSNFANLSETPAYQDTREDNRRKPEGRFVADHQCVWTALVLIGRLSRDVRCYHCHESKAHRFANLHLVSMTQPQPSNLRTCETVLKTPPAKAWVLFGKTEVMTRFEMVNNASAPVGLKMFARKAANC